ncbi:peptidoglycan DD-metalloendopeptidase family protein [uncultured Tyzzerella sp.]|uniref:peptidoglycan DD-metalloendopeptidase family protein n=1 Tax=uncultured Tyzzerella sp. TaxID=2321398 RepID=UPI0029429411|nr:peptidoglycan DD-metalloendopeptidase family protein [uncultured Tyzzerella sp.]
MSINVNKENYYEDLPNNKNKSNIINFPFKNNQLNLKEVNLVCKENTVNASNKKEYSLKNTIINKFYSPKNKETILNTQESSNNIISINPENNNGNNKIPPKPVALTVLGVILIVLSIWALTHKNAQEVYVGDKAVAIIKPNKDNVETPEQLKNLALSSLSEKAGANVEVNEDVSFKPIRASKNEIIPISDATKKVSESFTFKVEASIITVDGQPIATVKNKEEANKVLNSIKNKYVNKEKKQAAQPSFVQNVKIEDKYVNEKDIVTNEDALSLLTVNKDQGKEHEIKKGDTLFEIAMKNDMSLETLLKSNPTITETTPLKIGSKINVVVPVPLLSVVTYEEATYNMPIPKTIETIKNDKEYKTYKKVLSAGKDGTKQVNAKITKINGVEEKRDILSEKVLTPAVVEKVEVGTLNTPPKKSIGTFAYPVRGRLSSGFGHRWGTTHKGIDLACAAGTPIKASDGGTVVYSGWNNGGYGYMVKIDHGNGYQTVYAHNSRNAVSVGQKVAQGEVIAYVGSTGNSTGNHVHFEVIQGGVQKNPLNFLK